MIPDNELFKSKKDVDDALRAVFFELHELLEKSKKNPCIENSKELSECFQKMDDLQKKINLQIEELKKG